ncbi:HlyU family transcriptional regulator [Vibrio sp. RC27]
MGFLSRLFGGSDDQAPKDEYAKVEPVEHNGFSIYASSIKEGSQYRVAGKIEKMVDNELLSHRFVRSDVLASQGDANDLMINKAKVFIDQMGENIFQ